MSQWVWSARVGLILGIIVFVLAFVPILIVQYRRFGSMSFIRMLGAAATAIYVVAIASYTWLPLPERSAAWCAQYGIDTINLTPFAFMVEVRAVVSQVGIRAALRTVVVLQVVFNVVLFIPWGIIVRRYFQRGFVFTVLSGFAASLFVEATQATGLWGIYECAYRFADIDDLIMNTSGTVVGAIVAPVILFWMPRTETLTAQRTVARPISSLRRYASMLITLVLSTSFMLGGIVVVRMGLLVLNRSLESEAARALESLAAVVVVALAFYLPAIAGYGNIGMLVTWIAPRWRDHKGRLTTGSLPQRLLRTSVVGLPYLLSELGTWPAVDLLLWIAIGLSILLVPFTQNHRSLSGLLTHAELVDTRSFDR